MSLELFDYIYTDSRVVNEAYKSRSKFDIRYILNNVPANSSVYLYESADISSAGNILVERISLDIHEYCSENYNAH